MIKDIFDVIPAQQRDKARSALAATFGKAPLDAITPVIGGVSGALVFQVLADGRAYVLRIEGEPSPLRNPHQYASMRIAADAGIAPRIHYLDDVARVVVMDFIAEELLKSFPGGPPALAQAIGEMLQRLQTTPPFPRFIQYPEIVAGLWAHVCRTALFAPGVLDPYTRRLAQIREAYDWDTQKSVSSHNDLLPRNLLFDGKRLWLIDWESAYRNDPLVDVATAVDNFAASPELEDILLNAWFGHPPDQRVRERLTLVRALTRLYYAGVLFSAVAAEPRGTPDRDLAAPTLAQFEEALRDGRLAPNDVETRHVLGKMYLEAFLSGGPAPGLPPPFSHFDIKRDQQGGSSGR